jgi:uncharacterized SAM-binding protein YcdF (DUF218 family)
LSIFGELAELLRVYAGQQPRSVGRRPRVAVILGAQVHAGDMFARGEVDLLVPTGGLGEHPPAEAEVMSRILCGMGVPEGAILREDIARSTWESAVQVARISRREGIAEVVVVSDPLHCVRVVSAFERAGLAAVAEPAHGSPMWRKKWSRRGQLVRESGALMWYWIRHGVGRTSRR